MGDLMPESRASTAHSPLREPDAEATATAGRLMAILEERVASLVERHAVERRKVEELRASLAESEARARELVAGHERFKAELRARVERLIERVEALEQSHASDDGSEP